MNEAATASADTLTDIYRRAHLAMIHSMRAELEIKTGKVRMPFHSPRGQEIIPASISVLLSDRDYMVTVYRGAHDLICKGVPLKDLWAEYAGRVTGTCKGKGGPMHLTYPDAGAMVTTGVVGSGLPIANGLALSSQVRKDERVTVCYFGDGASNIGAFHESLNMASLWNLPVIFVCQNNLYAEHTSYARGTAVERIADRASGYSMPGKRVDGNDPLVMYAMAKEAIGRARTGNGPTLIEAMTFRFCGHSLGDGGHYMGEGELDRAMAQDPVVALKKYLLQEGYASEEVLTQIEEGNTELLDSAVEFAYASDYPEVSELKVDVFEQEIG